MRTNEELVTPVMAEAWLKRNTRNRTPNLARVETIAADILAGRWVVNGDAVRFGEDEELYDGQHRLMAICKAGVPVRTNVVRGLAPEARDFIDLGGAARTARDVVQITDGEKVSHIHVAWVAAADRMIDTGTLNGHTSAFTAAGLRRALARHGTALTALLGALGSGNGRRLVGAASVGAFLIAWPSHPDKVTAFVQAVKTGEGLAAGDAALTFRNHMIAQHGARVGSSAREDTALRTFAALDAYVRGEPLKILKANEGSRDRFIAAWKALDGKPRAAKVAPVAEGKFAGAIRASQLRDTKKRTPDAPPPPVEVVPARRSSTQTMAQIAAVRKYLGDGKVHRTWEIADACEIPRGSIGRVLTEALDVRNVGRGLWSMRKAA